jgi:hypothetical protein
VCVCLKWRRTSAKRDQVLAFFLSPPPFFQWTYVRGAEAAKFNVRAHTLARVCRGEGYLQLQDLVAVRHLRMCVCVCVCVCAEREREREREKTHSVFVFVFVSTHSLILALACTRAHTHSHTPLCDGTSDTSANLYSRTHIHGEIEKGRERAHTHKNTNHCETEQQTHTQHTQTEVNTDTHTHHVEAEEVGLLGMIGLG